MAGWWDRTENAEGLTLYGLHQVDGRSHILPLYLSTRWWDLNGRTIPRPAVHCVDIDELLAIHRGPVSSCFCTTNRFVIIIIQYCWFRCVIQDGLLAACQSLIEMDAKELRWSGSGNSHGDECSYNMRKRLDRQCITFCAAFLHHYYGAEWKGHFPAHCCHRWWDMLILYCQIFLQFTAVAPWGLIFLRHTQQSMPTFQKCIIYCRSMVINPLHCGTSLVCGIEGLYQSMQVGLKR